MIKVFNNLEEIKKYYNELTNTYVFMEDTEYIDNIFFNFDLNVNANIQAGNIQAYNIKCYDIEAGDVIVLDIDAHEINVRNMNARNIKANNIIGCNIKAHIVNIYDINDNYHISKNNIKANHINNLII